MAVIGCPELKGDIHNVMGELEENDSLVKSKIVAVESERHRVHEESI